MKKTLMRGAIAAFAAINLVFGTSIATAATTYTVEHVAPSNGNAIMAPFGYFGGKVITARGRDGVYLEATDRTNNSTVTITAEIADEGRYSIYEVPSYPTEVTSVEFDGRFWMSVFDDVEDNYDLLYSDGTIAGTGIVEIDKGSPTTDQTLATEGGIYFVADDLTTSNDDLFFFDGTSVTDLNVTDEDISSFPFMLREFQGKVSFLVLNDGDGTVEQFTAIGATETFVGVVDDMYSGCFGDSSLKGRGTDESNAYAVVWDECDESDYLWWTDDPDTEYSFLTDETGGISGAFFNGAWYFSGLTNADGRYGLVKAEGDSLTVDHSVIYPGGFVVFGDYLYFDAMDENNEISGLYKLGVDGAITAVVEDWNANREGGAVGAGINGAFFFQNTDADGDAELWVHDADGTRLASDILDGDDSMPDNFATLGSDVCFGAYASSEVDAWDLYCVSGDAALAETGANVDGIATGAVFALLIGSGLAVVGRRVAVGTR